MKQNQVLTITCKPNKKCMSFFGANGAVETNEFVFEDT